jgi:WD40 repeat protein/ferredoxin
METFLVLNGWELAAGVDELALTRDCVSLSGALVASSKSSTIRQSGGPQPHRPSPRARVDPSAQEVITCLAPPRVRRMKKLTFEPIGEAQAVRPGMLLNVLRSCGGHGLCATGHAHVRQGTGSLSPMTDREKRTLSFISGIEATSRLACQARVPGDEVLVERREGVYIGHAENLLSLLGERATFNILHPIDGSVLIAKGKIITRARLEELESLVAPAGSDDPVVLDAAPALNGWGRDPGGSCTEVVLVMRAEPVAYRTLPVVPELPREARAHAPPTRVWGIVLTLPPGPPLGTELCSQFGGDLFPQDVRDHPDIGPALLAGRLLVRGKRAKAPAAALELTAASREQPPEPDSPFATAALPADASPQLGGAGGDPFAAADPGRPSASRAPAAAPASPPLASPSGLLAADGAACPDGHAFIKELVGGTDPAPPPQAAAAAPAEPARYPDCLHLAGPLLALALDPSGRLLATGGPDQAVHLWDLTADRAPTAFRGHKDAVAAVAFCPAGRTLASASWDRTVRLWDLRTQEGRPLAGHKGHVHCVAFSPDGRLLASGSKDETVRLWDAATATESALLAENAGWVRSLAFSPDNRLLAAGSGDGTVKVWDLQSPRPVLTLLGHTGVVTSVAFSPDGRTLASGSWDNTVKLWEAATGRELASLTGHRRVVAAVAFSPDGQTVASAGWDRVVRLWDVPGRRARAELEGHTHWVRAVAFSPTGRWLASGGDDRTVRFRELPRGDSQEAEREPAGAARRGATPGARLA